LLRNFDLHSDLNKVPTHEYGIPEAAGPSSNLVGGKVNRVIDGFGHLHRKRCPTFQLLDYTPINPFEGSLEPFRGIAPSIRDDISSERCDECFRERQDCGFIVATTNYNSEARPVAWPYVL
jgi:hypothetical protein